MHSGQETESLFEFLIGHRVDGVVLASSRDNARLWAAHYRDKVPTVLLSDCLGTDVLDHDAINSVSLNNRLGGSMGVEYLYGLGHRDILYFGMRPNSITHQRRYQGYQNAMQEHGLTPTVVENPRDTSSISAGYAMAKELFLGGHTCTAIFAATDSIAIGVFQAADEFGIEIPGDISLLGFDNITYSGLPKIQLCTIDQRKPQLAEASVDLLLHLIDNADDGEYTHRVIRPALVERESCAPPRSAK
jgi:LacI family transcriptional regulator